MKQDNITHIKHIKLIIIGLLLCVTQCTPPLSGFFRNATKADIYLEIDYSAGTRHSKYSRPVTKVVEGWIVAAGETLEIKYLFIGFDIRVYKSADRKEELCRERIDQTFPKRQGKESWRDLITHPQFGSEYMYFVIKESGISCIKDSGH